MKKLILLFSLFALISCGEQQVQKQALKLVVTKDGKQTVTNWIKGVDSTLNIEVVYGKTPAEAIEILKTADAMISTGGDDVNPNWYGKAEYDQYCEGYDNYRDTLEIALIKYALENKVPVLGICRGHQIMNVTAGGTLIPDIETFNKLPEANHRVRNDYDSIHVVIPAEGSWIKNVYPNEGREYWINTLHHQAVDKVAPTFELAGISADSVVESIILKDKSQFALGVQWHPELAKDEFSVKIGQFFLDAAQKYQDSKQTIK